LKRQEILPGIKNNRKKSDDNYRQKPYHMLKMASISKWNSKKTNGYLAFKGGDVLWAYRIGKKEDYYSEKRNSIYEAPS